MGPLSQLREGKYISIHFPNKFFENVSNMILEYFDVPERKNDLIVLSPLTTTKEFRNKFPGKRIVIYQLEQMLGCNTYHNVGWLCKFLEGADELWDYDPLNVAWLAWQGITVDRVVPMLYTKSLEWKTPAQENPDFDVIFLGLLGQRRHKIMDSIQKYSYSKLKFSWVFGDEDMEKHTQRSKISLNLHSFEPWSRQEQVRMFVPIINGRTVISEKSQLNVMEDLILECEKDKLGQFLCEVSNSDLWRTFGLKAKEKYIEKTVNLLKQWPEAKKL